VIAAGAMSVAVIGDLLVTGNPEKRVREYIEALAGKGNV
jgi:thiamine monophosphate synthase